MNNINKIEFYFVWKNVLSSLPGKAISDAESNDLVVALGSIVVSISETWVEL